MYPPRHEQGHRGGRGPGFRDNQRRQHREHNDSAPKGPKILLKPPEGQSLTPDLFDSVANEWAKIVADDKPRTKDSQLRKFYDELLRWEDKVNGNGRGKREDAKVRLREHLPFIRMMNAKAAYAQGRKLVGASFVNMLRNCLEQVDDNPDTLRNCRLFFEAFIGFYKLHGPQN